MKMNFERGAQVGGVISFTKDRENGWLKAGWAFRQVLEDTLSRCPGDSEMARAFESAEACGGLDVGNLSPQLALRVTDAMRNSVIGILNGEFQSGICDKPYGDPRTVEQYLGALRELIVEFPVVDD
ncbi:MAG: hypothetical protein ABSD67_14720 [Terracidiphilus sp.]|jgi:hypothetical protein